MLPTSITASLALLLAGVSAIPPEDFGFPSAPNDTALNVAFPQPNGSYAVVSEAELFGVNITQRMPVVAVDKAAYQSLANYTGQYLLLMVDPDATTPQNPTSRFIFHWGQPSMTASNMTVSGVAGSPLMNSSAPWVPFRAPAPPPSSDAHRYILYAFHQPSNFSIPPAYRGFNAANRTRFNLTSFVTDARLGSPAAAQYFYVSSKTSVPGNFSAPASSSYPGGNGGQVTNGPGPMPSETGSGSAMSPTNTGAAASFGPGMAAAPVAGILGIASWLFL